MGKDLVTGGAGFIGSHLVDRLLADGRDVVAIDNLAVGHPRNLQQQRDNPHFTFVEGDIADPAVMMDVTRGCERLFHLAALADIVPSIQNPEGYYKSNVDGTFSCLQAARASQVRRFVYVASSSCYGIPDAFPTSEDAEIRPQYPYALTKWLGECMVMHWAQVYNLPAISLRFFNIYGPRARTSGTYGAVFGVFLAQLLAGEPLTIVGDGNQTRDFTFVSDAVDALVTAARSDISGACYNVGSDAPTSINRLVELLGAENVVHIPKRPGEPDCTFADTSRIKRDLKWVSSIPIEDGVTKMLDNIDYWRDAPVWTPESISTATADWFKYLSTAK